MFTFFVTHELEFFGEILDVLNLPSGNAFESNFSGTLGLTYYGCLSEASSGLSKYLQSHIGNRYIVANGQHLPDPMNPTPDAVYELISKNIDGWCGGVEIRK